MTFPQTLIIANGDLKRTPLINKIMANRKRLICADGGIRHAHEMKSRPDILIGDLDSAPMELREWSVETIHVKEQETTDLEKAVHYCVNEGTHEICVLGAFGNRRDHFLNHLRILRRSARDASLFLISENELIFVIKSEFELYSKTNKISFFGLPLAEKVSLEGFDYPVRDVDFQFGEFCSVSNSLTGTSGRAEVSRGLLLCVIEIPPLLDFTVDGKKYEI